MTFDLEELREAEILLSKIAAHTEKILPVLELLKVTGSSNAIIPPATDRLLEQRQVLGILKIGQTTLNNLVTTKQLTPLLIAGSSSWKYRLSEVIKIIETAAKKSKQKG